ncbi:hypothetical protein [Pseudemcibacter aquimaris]|uniref:hypothetical protein n=1 Tax=Pseudemcibacter aquimaris TaxID=2857064 RepID=UPI00201305DD|nr:hypothetical protein [Pseudemcibacter aquimaris]MCC3861768.1 hypothetical protein [Pseudemcibacter aquimaris]WDU58534.1 hypothetical protein KW060_15200 [Pseudemcibacter aquimaris]
MSIFKTISTALILVLFTGTSVSLAANRTSGNLDFLNQDLNSGYAQQYAAQNNKSYSIALKFVRSSGLHKSLSLLLLDSVKSDAVVEQAITLHGFENVKKSVVANIQSTTVLYRSQWVELLAGLYSDQFDAKVMQSIVEQGEKSPHFAAFLDRQHKANTSEVLMQSELFKEARQRLIDSLKLNFTAMVQ